MGLGQEPKGMSTWCRRLLHTLWIFCFIILILTHNTKLNKLSRKKSLVGDLRNFSRVLSQSYGHHHARIKREPLRLLHPTAHTPRVWLSTVHPLTRAPFLSFIFHYLFLFYQKQTSLNILIIVLFTLKPIVSIQIFIST